MSQRTRDSAAFNYGKLLWGLFCGAGVGWTVWLFVNQVIGSTTAAWIMAATIGVALSAEALRDHSPCHAPSRVMRAFLKAVFLVAIIILAIWWLSSL